MPVVPPVLVRLDRSDLARNHLVKGTGTQSDDPPAIRKSAPRSALLDREHDEIDGLRETDVVVVRLVLAHLGLRAPPTLGRRRLHAEPLAVRSDIEVPSGVRR